MKINQQTLHIRDVVEGYKDKGVEGVVGYGGRLDIRPSFQREFVYKEKQQKAVIHSILNGYPLNVMYWVKRGEKFEVLDGQQRIISIGRFVDGKTVIQINGKDQFFHSLSSVMQDKILDYELTVYFCEGTDDETLEWFEIVNLAGEQLRPQEIRNAVYGGSWVEAAKLKFSKPGCVAFNVGGKYLNGSSIRQDYLETTIDWLSDGNINHFMAQHKDEPNADVLWEYFESVIEWVQFVFPTYHKSMKGIDWGALYKDYQHNYGVPRNNEKEVLRLLKDEDVTNKRGIYEYILSGKVPLLNIRQFSDSDKEVKYKEQKGICAKCREGFKPDEMEGDHVTPWIEGGKTEFKNLQMLCKSCNRLKGAR